MKSLLKKQTKRAFLFFTCILFSMVSFSATYFVSASGNDSNDGLSIISPWKTLGKVNSATFAANDVILFRSGDTWFGSIIPQRSNLTYGAYNAGAKPVISGFQIISGWNSVGNGIYSASTTATVNSNMVTVNGVNTPAGRYPKTGWLTFESFVSNISITDSQLSGTPNWTGGEVVIKKNNFTIDRSLITNHTNTTITYTSGSTYSPKLVDEGYSYFIHRHISALTQLGDWYCDGTNLYMYFGSNNPNSYVVKASNVTNVFDLSERGYITLNNLTIEGGNSNGVYANLAANINVTNCDLRFNGQCGITTNSCNVITVDGCNINNNNRHAVFIVSTASTLRNSIIDMNGVFAGMGYPTGDSYTAVEMRSTGGLIEYNTITNSGYIGIEFYNSNFIVRYNVIDGFCNLITDGSGIYTFYGSPGTVSSGQKVYNNIVMNGNGNGLYNDNSANNVEWYNNTVINMGKKGLHMNDGYNTLIHDNVFFKSGSGGISIQNLYMNEGNNHDNSLYNNIVVQSISASRMFDLADARTGSIVNFGTSDNNTFIVESSSLSLFKKEVVLPSYSNINYTFNDWKTLINKEARSTLTAKNLADVTIHYNDTKSAKTISLSSPMVDTKGTKYSSSVTLQPFTSVVLMKDLTIPMVNSEENIAVCEGTDYNGWTITGKYERSLTAMSGGDSIVTTYLTVNPKYSITEDIIINEGENYNGWTTEGQYFRTLTSVYGCDSIVTTNLTVAPIAQKEGEIVPLHFTTVWEGENGQNHMNILVISATLEDLPLVADDEIALFSGSSCVGAKRLTQSISADNNMTSVTISASQNDGSNNGFNDNDTIIFKIWDNRNQKEMLAKAVIYRNDVTTWLTSGKYSPGATSVVEIVSYVENTQTIELKKGYNLMSSYVSSTDEICTVTKTLVDQGNLIKIQDETGNSYENWGAFGGWINNLGSIKKTEGYKIKVANNCTLELRGRPIILPFDIPLKTGWNIISFPSTEMIDAKAVMQSLIDQNKLVKVQDEEGNSIEDWGIFGGWKNGIGNFIPGKAYKVKMNADAVLTIQQNYLKSVNILAKTEKAVYFSTGIEGNSSDHMNVNIVGLKESGVSIGDEIAAFDGDICVGTLKLTADHLNIGSASLVASVYDDDDLNGFKDGHLIQIMTWNAQSGEESITQAESINGKMIYERQSSVFVNLKSETTGVKKNVELFKIDIFPNPCSDNLNVRFSEMPDAGSSIEIMDITGRKVVSREITSTNERFFLGQQPAGLYLVKTIIGSKEVLNKLIINK